MTKTFLFATLGCLATVASLPAAAQVEAPAVPAVAEADADGFIYGTVETTSGNTYKGILRWGTEESFWGDHFNSSKEELPYMEDRDRDRRRRVRVFGVTVGYRWEGSWGSRQFIARFGDIARLDLHRGDNFTATMKNGEKYELEGGSNDIGAKITVLDASLGEVKLDWKKIDSIVFEAAPRGTRTPARRLYGVLTTEDGEKFEGFVQWDIQECLWTDELDGETDDGDVSIEMGRIRAIEKRNRRGAWVELKDGRRMLLEGTNDVDSSTDGIFIEDDRYGRVEVSWDAFERLDFQDTSRSGPGYESYKPLGALTGSVTDIDGKTYRGEIVYDLDERRGWEMLNGERDDLEFHIPFFMVRSVEPIDRDASRVVLKNGEKLELEDGNDVTDDNDGIVVIGADGESTIPWDEVKIVQLD